MDRIKKIQDLLYGAGEPMEGTAMGVEAAAAYVRERFSDTPFCIVRDWIWIDLELVEMGIQMLRDNQLSPAMLYAHNVVYDSAHRYREIGGYVRTTPLLSFSEGFLFQTRNTMYVLLGKGVRKRATLEVVSSLL